VKVKQQGDNSEKPKPDYVEGAEAFQRFDSMMTTLIAVPRSVIEERERAYQRQSKAVKRSPKSKKTPRKA
jgi:hypothetical protein